MAELGADPRSNRSPGTSAWREAGSEALIDGLCQALAEAAGRGLLLTSGALSRRKIDWLLSELADELRQAEQLVDALKNVNTQRSQGR